MLPQRKIALGAPICIPAALPYTPRNPDSYHPAENAVQSNEVFQSVRGHHKITFTNDALRCILQA
jgi:hypothetical protein